MAPRSKKHPPNANRLYVSRRHNTRREEAVDDVHGKVRCLREEAEAHVCPKGLREEVDCMWCHDPRNTHLMPTNCNWARDMTCAERKRLMMFTARWSVSGRRQKCMSA